MFGTYITEKIGNNALSYEKRKKLESKCKLYIPNVKEVIFENLNKHLKSGEKIVFEEVENNKLLSFVGLENYLVLKKGNSQICIFDNHNIAFYFIGKYFLENKQKLDLIHIDQHSDLYKPNFIPKKLKNLDQIINYTFYLNVGNYLKPLKKLNFIGEIQQFRTETSIKLLNLEKSQNSIINIDLDFWAPGMTTTSKSLQKIQKLIGKAPLILIATSPYFLEQNLALSLIFELLH